MKPCAKWTDDCQGKKDYDGRLLSISTRYWPSLAEQKTGNHINMFSNSGEPGIHPYEPDGRPSAKASILLNFGEPDEYGYGDYLTWREQEFVADTQAEVKAVVEAWVQERMNEVCLLLGIEGGGG